MREIGFFAPTAGALGVGESMSPGILGFTVLSLSALILALGVYRQNPV